MLPEKAFALSGREIMEKVNDRDVGNRSISEMEMILIDKKEINVFVNSRVMVWSKVKIRRV